MTRCPSCGHEFAPLVAVAFTPRQRDLLVFVRDYIAQTGTAPSFNEMKAAIGLKSKSGVHRLLSELAERGAIRRLRHRPRAIDITDAAKQIIERVAA